MAATIFVRERRKIEDGEKKPRFRVVGVCDGDIKIFAKHLRRVEVEQIAKEAGAKVLYLKSGKGERDGSKKQAV